MQEEIEIDFKAIFSKVVKHRRTIAGSVFVCVALALLYSFISTPIYRSTARLLVEGKPPRITKVDDVVLPIYSDQSDYFNSQVEVLKSHTIAKIAFEELGGYEPWSRRNKPAEKLEPISDQERMDYLLFAVKINELRMTNVIEINVEDTDPRLAAVIANAWTSAYLMFSSYDQLIQHKSELESDIKQQMKYLKEKHPVIQGLRQEIEAIDEKIKENKKQVFSSSANFFSFTNSDHSLTSVKILDEALVSRIPVRPKKVLNIILGLFLGLFFGVGLAFIFENFDQSLKTSADVENIIKLSCLAAIPFYSPGKNDTEAAPSFVAFSQRQSIDAEAFRNLRTSINFSNPDLAKKVIMITSAVPVEGKSSVALNLAIVFAQTGEKVIIIDADLRRPKLHGLLQVDRLNGFTEFLASDSDNISSFIHKTKIPNLDILACGTVPPNPSELLGSHKIEGLIKKLSQVYNHIIFDTPPVLVASDAVVLSTKVDATVVVVKAGATNQKAVLRCVKSILDVRSKVLGVVLNMVKPQEHGGDHYDYHYLYGKYGKEDKQEKQDKKDKRTGN